VAWRSSDDRPVGYGATGVDRASCATYRYAPTVRYVNGRTRTIAIVFCGEIFWLMLIGVIHFHSATDKESLALVASLMVILAIRSGFAYVLILEPHQLRAKTLTRTRLWRYSELRSAERVVAPSAHDRGFIILRPSTSYGHSTVHYEAFEPRLMRDAGPFSVAWWLRRTCSRLRLAVVPFARKFSRLR
jgi:hypothetical protein